MLSNLSQSVLSGRRALTTVTLCYRIHRSATSNVCRASSAMQRVELKLSVISLRATTLVCRPTMYLQPLKSRFSSQQRRSTLLLLLLLLLPHTSSNDPVIDNHVPSAARNTANFTSLWSPYGTGQTIIFSSCFFLSSFFFFPRLISAVGDWMSTILPHMMWP